MGRVIHNIANMFRDAPVVFTGVVGLVVTAMMLWVAVIYPWLQNLDLTQRVVLTVTLILVVVMCGAWIWLWHDRKAIQKIPNMLRELDQITLDLIDQWDNDTEIPEEAIEELADIYGISTELRQLRARAQYSTPKNIKATLDKIATAHSSRIKEQEATRQLAQASAILDSYGIGLETLRGQTPQYYRIYNKVRELQEHSPNAIIGISINRYFRMSDSLCSVLLGAKPFEVIVPELRELLPARFKANAKLMRRETEEQTEVLILKVREEISKAQSKSKASNS